MENSQSRKNYTPGNTTSKKRSRKGENPICLTSTTENSCDVVSPTTRICRNWACRSVVSTDVGFCQRCSCCICYHFDDYKDPSLWLVCESDSGQGDSCGLSCHIECAFQKNKLGVVNLGQFMQLDGSYWCVSCGKVSGILGCWKKQVALAKEAWRLDVLCHRIYLSYRLLEGTAKFKELHGIITEAKTKLEEVMGPLNGDSVKKMKKGIVNRIATAVDVQKLCVHAIDKANEVLANDSTMSLNGKDVTVGGELLPVACRFLFEEVTSSSLAIIVIDIPVPIVDSVIGYKLWYCKSQEELFSDEPLFIFTRETRRILVKHLQPCTEYTFRIIPYTEAGDLGHSEAKCYTKSFEDLDKDPSSAGLKICNPSLMDHTNLNLGGSCSSSKVQDIGKNLHLAWTQNQGRLEGNAIMEQCCGVTNNDVSPENRQPPPVFCEFDLNVVLIPDLNEDPIPPLESSWNEDNGWPLEHATGTDDAAAFHGVEKNWLGLAKSNDSGPSDNSWALGFNQNGEVRAVDSLADKYWNRASSVNEETPGNDSGQLNGSPVRVTNEPVTLDENSDHCLKFIHMLETQGHINRHSEEQLMSWYLSTEQDRQAFNIVIRALEKDPKSIASFGYLISS